MKKIILSLIVIMIISNAIVYFMGKMSRNYEDNVTVKLYEQQLIAFKY